MKVNFKKIYVLCIAMTLFFTKTTGQNLPCYTTYSSNVSNGPYSSASADFNKDGFVDVIFAPSTVITTTVLLRLNDGFGNLNAAITTNTFNNNNGYAWGICAADFDNNGYVDYAVSTSKWTGSNQVNVFLNTGGSGTTFTLASGSPFYNGSTTLTEIKAAYLNNDAFPDLLVGSPDISFGVLLNSGSGSFSAMTAYNGGGLWGINVLSYDVNIDGNNDIIVAGQVQSVLGLFLGSPSGTFAIAPGFPIPTVPGPRQVDWADFDNDGKEDLVVAGQTANNIGVHLAVGTNSFSGAITFTTSESMFGSQAGDFNGDGNMDFVAVSYGKSYYYVGNGAASFTLANGYPKTGAVQYWSALKTDLTNDGVPELVINDRNGSAKIDVLYAAKSLSVSASASSFCAGLSSIVTATGSSAVSYTWIPGNLSGATQTLSPGITTSYSIYALSSPSSACNYYGKITLTVSPLPSLSVTSTNSNLCAGQTATLTASGASTCTWNPGGPGTTIPVTPSVTSTYTVIGTDLGCDNSNIISIIVNPNPTITAVSSSNTLCIGETASLTASGANTYTWNPGGSGITISISPSVNTTYTVSGKDGNGCLDTVSITQIVSNCIGIDELAMFNYGVSIFPNPNNGEFIISLFTTNEDLYSEIYNIHGQMVRRELLVKASTKIDLNEQSNGIYFVKIIKN
jgi:hypothetical protein